MINPEFANVLIALGYRPLDDFILSVPSVGDPTLDWYSDDDEPKAPLLDSLLSGELPLYQGPYAGKTFAQWALENGGDKSASQEKQVAAKLQATDKIDVAFLAMIHAVADRLVVPRKTLLAETVAAAKDII